MLNKKTIVDLLELQNEHINDYPITKGDPRFSEIFEITRKLYKNKEWRELFIWFQSHVRFPLFLEIYEELNDEEYFSFLGMVLNRGSYFYDFSEELLFLLNHPKKDINKRFKLMDEKELKIYNSLPERGTIYRGAKIKTAIGHSWTLDKDKAKWFASRYNGTTVLIKGEFKKKDVIAYFGREKEIFIDPENIRKKKHIKIFENILDYNPREMMHHLVIEKITIFPGYKKLKREMRIESRVPVL